MPSLGETGDESGGQQLWSTPHATRWTLYDRTIAKAFPALVALDHAHYLLSASRVPASVTYPSARFYRMLEEIEAHFSVSPVRTSIQDWVQDCARSSGLVPAVDMPETLPGDAMVANRLKQWLADRRDSAPLTLLVTVAGKALAARLRLEDHTIVSREFSVRPYREHERETVSAASSSFLREEQGAVREMLEAMSAQASQMVRPSVRGAILQDCNMAERAAILFGDPRTMAFPNSFAIL